MKFWKYRYTKTLFRKDSLIVCEKDGKSPKPGAKILFAEYANLERTYNLSSVTQENLWLKDSKITDYAQLVHWFKEIKESVFTFIKTLISIVGELPRNSELF